MDALAKVMRVGHQDCFFQQNKLELEFLVAIDWNVFVTVEDFQLMTSKLETAVVTRQVSSRGWTTYTDLLVLSRNLQMQKLWTLLAECTIKVRCLSSPSSNSFIATNGPNKKVID